MKTLIIDAGHGGSDNGASAFGYLEKELNLIIAKRVKELLKEYDPDITRTKDITLDPIPRTNKIKNKYKYCLSIHLNAFNGSASGIETIHSIYSKRGKQLAEIIAKKLNEKMGLPIRRVFSRKGKNGDYYYMHRLTGSTTTVIVEGLFLDNDIEYLNVENIAQGIAEGFKEFIEGDKEEPTKQNEIKESKSKYYTLDGLHVIETTPDNVYIWKLGNTLRGFGIYGINGTWQDNKNAKNPSSIWGLACNRGKPIGDNSHTNSPKGYKRGTIIYYKDGTIEVKRINNINEINKTYDWAIGGGMLLPHYNPEIEGFTGAFSDVLRRTNHTGIGYRDNKVFLFAKENCTMEEFLDSIRLLQLKGAIFLDGGGSTQLNYKNKGIHSGRILSHGIFIKEV